MDTTSSKASVPGDRIALRPYAQAVGWILFRFLLQTIAAFIASVIMIIVCWLPTLTSLGQFRVMTAVAFSVGLGGCSSILSCVQLVAESFFLLFALVEFGKALLRIFEIGWPRMQADAPAQ